MSTAQAHGWILGATLLTVFGALALLVAGIGLYGVLAFHAIALALGRFVEPLLFQVPARDPLVLGGVAAVLIAVGVLASLLPGLRATRVDPMEALRAG